MYSMSHPERSQTVRVLFLSLALVNFVAAAVTGGLVNLTAGFSLVSLSLMWGNGSDDE